MKVAAIYLNQTNKRIDKPYDYAIPVGLEQNVRPGMRVAVPFGRGSRLLEGFVIQVKEETAFFDRLRPIEAIIDTEPILSAKQIASFHRPGQIVASESPEPGSRGRGSLAL